MINFFKKSKLEKVLNKIKKDRTKYFSGDINNILFLDFDGVLNLDINNYTGNFKATIPMKNLNKFCIENEFKIVVISSWRRSINYEELLYESGLNKKIHILGATEDLKGDRESEIIDYLEKNTNVNNFIILDDGDFNELSKYQIKTVFCNGFDDSKYDEAVKLLNKERRGKM